MQRPVGVIDLALIAALALMWGSAFLLIKLALPVFLPIDIVFWRLLVASLALAILCVFSGQPLPRRPSQWLMIAALGAIANGLPFFLVSWSETRMDSGFSAMMIASVPLWTAALIPLFVPEEHLTRRRVTGIVIGFLGVALLTGGLSASSWHADLLAKACLLIAAFSYAAGVIIIRRLWAVPALATAMGMNVTAWLSVVPAALLLGEPLKFPTDWPATLAVGGLGLFSSAAASLVLVLLIGRIGAARASVTNYLVPLVAALLGALVLDERMGPENLAGLALILVGVGISTRQPRAGTTP